MHTNMSSITLLLLITIFYGIVAPPVVKNQQKENETSKDGLEDYMEYHRYLREVVNALESDSEFKKKLEQANEDDIRSGKIAHELEFVAHHVRTQLDEIKRRELDRLKELMKKEKDLMNDNDIDEDPLHHHIDHENPHTFEIDDLKKLIKKTTADLAEADRKRREQFKMYEMQKEYEKQLKLNQTSAEERLKLEAEYAKMEDKHKKHERLHEPGHKQQLEEVWEEQDQMQQNFDPKTFFLLHDLDGNGLWDETEVKALFIKELDKMYAAGAPEDDMRERAEEMERMREAVFQEVDLNRDGFIDFDEFIAQTKRNDFQQDHGWQGLDEQRQFTEEEYNEYVRQHNAAYQHAPPGYYPPPPSYQGHPQGGYQEASAHQAPHSAQQIPPGGFKQPYVARQVPPGGYQQGPPGNYQQGPPAYQMPPGGQPLPPNGHVPQSAYKPPSNSYPAPVGNDINNGQAQAQRYNVQQEPNVNQQSNPQMVQRGNDVPNDEGANVRQNNVEEVNQQKDHQGFNSNVNHAHEEPVLQSKHDKE